MYQDGNYVSGSIPKELVGLRKLEELNLWPDHGPTHLRGCVPVELPDIWIRTSGLERCPHSSNGKEAE